MLKCIGIDKTTDKNFTEKLLVNLRFSSCDSTLLGASFATSTYSIVAHLDQLVPIVKNDKNENDLDDTLRQAREKYVGTEEKNAYGFDIAVSEIIPNAKFLKVNDLEIAQRSIMGIGATEELAKENAIQRETARLNFAIAKGRIEVVYEGE